MTSTPVTRRAAVLGAATLAATTACATYGRRPDDAAPAPRPAPGSAPAPLAATTDVPVGGGIVLAEQGIVVTQPTAGQFAAFSAVCTHQGCTVGAVAEGAITCPCHGSSFAVADGSVVTGPASRPLARRQVAVDGDAVVLA